MTAQHNRRHEPPSADSVSPLPAEMAVPLANTLLNSLGPKPRQLLLKMIQSVGLPGVFLSIHDSNACGVALETLVGEVALWLMGREDQYRELGAKMVTQAHEWEELDT